MTDIYKLDIVTIPYRPIQGKLDCFQNYGQKFRCDLNRVRIKKAENLLLSYGKERCRVASFFYAIADLKAKHISLNYKKEDFSATSIKKIKKEMEILRSFFEKIFCGVVIIDAVACASSVILIIAFIPALVADPKAGLFIIGAALLTTVLFFFVAFVTFCIGVVEGLLEARLKKAIAEKFDPFDDMYERLQFTGEDAGRFLYKIADGKYDFEAIFRIAESICKPDRSLPESNSSDEHLTVV